MLSINKLVCAIALYWLLQLTTFEAKAATVEIRVDWPAWSGENQVTFRDSSNNLVSGTPNPICDPNRCFNGADGSYNSVAAGDSIIFTGVASGTYNLLMEDSFGDGWNGGGSITVLVDGVEISGSPFLGPPNGSNSIIQSFTIAAPAIVNCPVGSTATGSGMASSGSGLYRDDIFWLDWSCGSEASFDAGETINKSWNAPNGVVISATISNLSSSLVPYNTGAYFGDQLDSLYGGVNPIGLRNQVDSQDPNFDINFTVTVNGQSVEPDIIIADAESTDAANESFTITTSGQAWELIERSTGASLDVVFSNSDQTLFWNDNPDGGFGSLVAVSENATNLNVQINAGGLQALAFGVMTHYDYGDAPISYGDVVHYGFMDFSGGNKPVIATDINSITLSTMSTEPTYLGTNGTDADLTQQNSIDATGDDSDADGDDEDGVSSFPAVNASSASYSLTVACNGTGAITGWIDWAIDGTFDDGTIDEAAATTCSGGTATLVWSGLTGLSDGTTFARIRASNMSSTITTPNGEGISGEVEDYSFVITPAADIEVVKTSINGNFTPGGTDTYTITITNNGPSDVTGLQVADTLPDGVTFTGTWTCSATAGSSCSSANGGAVGGSEVTGLTASIINGGSITLTIPVQYSLNPQDY